MVKVERKFDDNGRISEAFGSCSCGVVVNFLERDCYDTVECSCGKLYNSSGQELRPRNQWEENMEEDY